jgi:hypothetical protein
MIRGGKITITKGSRGQAAEGGALPLEEMIADAVSQLDKGRALKTRGAQLKVGPMHDVQRGEVSAVIGKEGGTNKGMAGHKE